MRRRLELDRPQLFGVPLLLIMPILSMFGTFGDREERATHTSAEIELTVDWPPRTRHELISRIDVRVRNISPEPIDTLTVAFDAEYLHGFSAVSTTPGGSQAWEVELLDVGVGETRGVAVELDALRYGSHSGPVLATSGGADTARVVIRTFTFP